MRSTLTVFSVSPRSTVMRLFCRTRKEEFPITNTRFEFGPVSTRSPDWMGVVARNAWPFSWASPFSSTMLLRCCAKAAPKPPMDTQAAAPCRKLRRRNQNSSSSVRP